MNEELRIIWSPTAEDTYSQILKYIIDHWSLNAAAKFDGKVNRLLNLLKTNHQLCPKSEKSGLRKCVITHQASLIYRVYKNRIELVAFLDNRSDHEF